MGITVESPRTTATRRRPFRWISILGFPGAPTRAEPAMVRVVEFRSTPKGRSAVPALDVDGTDAAPPLIEEVDLVIGNEWAASPTLAFDVARQAAGPKVGDVVVQRIAIKVLNDQAPGLVAVPGSPCDWSPTHETGMRAGSDGLVEHKSMFRDRLVFLRLKRVAAAVNRSVFAHLIRVSHSGN